MISKTIDAVNAFLLQYVFKYRKDVIVDNLTAAYQFKEKADLEVAVKKNYRFLAKVFRQTLFHPSRGGLVKKMEMKPSPEVEQWLAENKSVLVVCGHVGNWEWAGSLLALKYHEYVCGLYKKIKSSYLNNLINTRRLKFAKYLVEIGNVGDLLRLMRKQPLLVMMIADQNPGSDQGIIWVKFMGRDTAFVNGPETLAMRYHLPVVYLNIKSYENGNYLMTFETVFDGKEKVNAGEITQRFADRLENNITNNDMEWLWSHRRWKRNKNMVNATL